MTKPPVDPVQLARSVTKDVFEVLLDTMRNPAGRHDDQVDALGLVGQLLDRMFVPGRPHAHHIIARDRWDTTRAGATNWKTV